jgi:predicted membrane GTPase involved in stress response
VVHQALASSVTTVPLSDPVLPAASPQVPPPTVLPDAPLQLLVTNIDFDEHKGRIAIGRVTAGAHWNARRLFFSFAAS